VTDRWTSVIMRQEITEEVEEIVRGVVDGWYSEGRIDWENVWERVDGSTLDDGSRLDLGTDLMSPAIRTLKTMIRRERSNG
jgi:hypothetical protein